MALKSKLSAQAADHLYPVVLDHIDDRRAVVEAGIDYYFAFGPDRCDQVRVKEWVGRALDIWNECPHLRCGLTKEEFLSKMKERPANERESLLSSPQDT